MRWFQEIRKKRELKKFLKEIEPYKIDSAASPKKTTSKPPSGRKRATEADFYHLMNTIQSLHKKWVDINEDIEIRWSKMYRSQNFNDPSFIDLCRKGIALDRKVEKADAEYYGANNRPRSAVAYKRLAMYFEKNGQFEEAVEVCKEAIRCNVNEGRRLERMIKKAKRQPDDEESRLIEYFADYTNSNMKKVR